MEELLAMRFEASQLETLCACGHSRKWHSGREKDGDCAASIEGTFKFCSCKRFKEHQFKNEEEIEMAKKEKAAKKEVAPKLAAFVDSPFKIYLAMGKKEREASVLSSGLIRFNDNEYRSPCAAATAMAKDMGEKWTLNAWTALKFNQDGERVPLDKVRGAKSPLKAVEAKPKKAAKTPKPKAVKKARKPRKAKAAESSSEAAAPEQAVA